MNAVEIEEAISNLAAEPFDPEAFPYAFLEAFGNKETTIKRLKIGGAKSGGTNQSDVLGGILQRTNIHLKTCAEGEVTATLKALRESSATTRHKVKFILATDGAYLEAENLLNGETVACEYSKFPDHFGFFLLLAGITTVREIRENAFDIKATSRLNRLYVELLKENRDWDTDTRRSELNHFFARLIFCFFAEDTGIFDGTNARFTATVEQMSAPDASNMHEVLYELFRAMNTSPSERQDARIRNWAGSFPYVNGGLFSGSLEVPRFSKIARSYLLHVGNLDWTKINPDIFGSMIQAVADEEERGELGMHYTSVPNILKVLNPLFLDDLRAQLEEAGDNGRKLFNLRTRMAQIRVFDPACGSGNFLVIAYKKLREIEAEINKRRNEQKRKSEIPLTNFRGIELRNFAAEIARLALVIAEYQCDVLYRGQELALAEMLPLEATNWITCGNALRLDWLDICPAAESGEAYLCGNPPYLGSTWQSTEQKEDLKHVFEGRAKSWKSLDYVAGWFMKAADYGTRVEAATAFVATNSICQGQQVPILWPVIFKTGHEIAFAHTSFKWANLASHNAGVTVAIIGISNHAGKLRKIFSETERGPELKEVSHINAYLVSGLDAIVERALIPMNGLCQMIRGNMPYDGGHLLLSHMDLVKLDFTPAQIKRFIRYIYGSAEFIRGIWRCVLWIEDEHLEEALAIPKVKRRIENVRSMRLGSRDSGANEMAERAHQMREMNIGQRQTIVVPCVTSESREFLPVGLIDSNSTVTNLAFALYDAPLWNMALIASRLHLIWIATVCGQLETRYRYSNTLGWNTFPVPTLTEQNKADLTRCAEDILLTREAHFPATIADLYDPENMPSDLREAHDRNDETLERIYIGRRFKNDTERLEKLFELYTKMTYEKRSTQKVSKTKKDAA